MKKRIINSGILLAWVAASLVAAEKPAVRVMTRNLYAGADLDFIFTATDEASFVKGTATVLNQVRGSGIPERVARVADEIAANQPDLVALQEVTLWRTGKISSPPASEVLFDHLDLLIQELAKRKLSYAPVAVQTLLDAEAPVPTAGIDLRITDRDVILARNDLMQAEMDVTNVQARRYQAKLSFGNPLLGSITVPRGWMSVDVTLRGAAFRFVNTHLESGITGVPSADQAQVKQGDELINLLSRSDVAVILCGDFNSNAEPGPEHYDTYQHLLWAGYVDAWRTANPADPGYTWPLYAEDQPSPAIPNERLDLILTRGLKTVGFSNGLTVVRMERTGAGAPFASDHAGVAATFRLD